MPKKRCARKGVYAYLDGLGLLEQGSDEAIRAAKQAYRKQYKYEWQKAYRRQKSITLYFNEAEYRVLSEGAGKHKMSRTRFAKKALIAYTKRVFVVPDLEIIHSLMQLLKHACCIAEVLLRSEKVSFKEGKRLVEQNEQIEAIVREKLLTPRCLDDLLGEAIRKDSARREYFLDLIKNM